MTELKITDALLFVAPWVKSLESQLICSRSKTIIEWVEGEDGVKREVSTRTVSREPLYVTTPQSDGTEAGIVLPGLFQRTKRWLEKNGYAYTVKDERTDVDPPDWTRLSAESWRVGQKEILAMMCSQRRALIDGPTGLGKTFAIEQFCRLYPKKNILIVTGRAQARDDIFERVRDADPGRKIQAIKGGVDIKPWTSVIVMVGQSLHRIEDDWPDILIYDEVHNAGKLQTCVQLNRFLKTRMYGLSASVKGRHDNSDRQVEAFFGPTTLRIPYEKAAAEGDVAPMNVKIFPVKQDDCGPCLKAYREQVCIERNRYRNKLIGHVVRSVVPEDEQVLILVNHTEHAYRLRQYIPDAVLVHRALTGTRYAKFAKDNLIRATDPQKPDVDQIRKDFKDGKIKRVIATRMWQEAVDFPNLWYLVRADGLSTPQGSVQMAGRLSRTGGQKGREGVLITFSDEHDGMKNRIEVQLKEYRRRKWRIEKLEIPKKKLW